MLFNDGIKFFKDLLSGAKAAEAKVYIEFIGILKGLKSIELTKERQQHIEHYLEGLALTSNPENKRRFYKKKYNELVTYLSETFSLVTEGYYAALGMTFGLSIGAGLGITIGASFGQGTGIGMGISFGAGLGLVIGMFLGSVLDANAKKEGRVLNSEID